MHLKCNTRGNGNARRDALKHLTYHPCKSTGLQLLQTKHCVVRPLSLPSEIAMPNFFVVKLLVLM